MAIRGKNSEEIFTSFYERHLWNERECRSGAGSTLSATSELRHALPGLLASLNVRTLLDAPCGDFHWMKEVPLDLDLYIGGDIVRSLIEHLDRTYGDPKHRFVQIDITKDALPEADALLCRDCLIHLSLDEATNCIANALRSRCRFLLASTYVDCRSNRDIATGLARPLNLCLEPFSLPSPLCLAADPSPKHQRKQLGVWDLEQLRPIS